jgi:hypothetical protein
MKNLLQFIIYYNSANNNLIFNNKNNDLLFSLLLNIELNYVDDKSCEDIIDLSKNILKTKLV